MKRFILGVLFVLLIITSGSGLLTTGGIIVNKKASAGAANVMNGPSGGGTAGAGAYTRKVQEGDIIIIPTGVGHGWSQITDHVTYLSVRPDPDRVLPSGYVYPLLLKNQPSASEGRVYSSRSAAAGLIRAARFAAMNAVACA